MTIAFLIALLVVIIILSSSPNFDNVIGIFVIGFICGAIFS